MKTGALTVNDVLTVGSTGYIVGGATSYTSGTGFFLGYSAGYKFRIGTTSGNRMTWDGSALNVYGNLTAGYVSIDSNGIAITASGGIVDSRAYRFSGISAGVGLDTSSRYIRLYAPSNYVAYINAGGTTLTWTGANLPPLGGDGNLGSTSYKWQKLYLRATGDGGLINIGGTDGVTTTLTCSSGEAVKNLTVIGGVVTSASCGAP